MQSVILTSDWKQENTKQLSLCLLHNSGEKTGKLTMITCILRNLSYLYIKKHLKRLHFPSKLEITIYINPTPTSTPSIPLLSHPLNGSMKFELDYKIVYTIQRDGIFSASWHHLFGNKCNSTMIGHLIGFTKDWIEWLPGSLHGIIYRNKPAGCNKYIYTESLV